MPIECRVRVTPGPPVLFTEEERGLKRKRELDEEGEEDDD